MVWLNLFLEMAVVPDLAVLQAKHQHGVVQVGVGKIESESGVGAGIVGGPELGIEFEEFEGEFACRR